MGTYEREEWGRKRKISIFYVFNFEIPSHRTYTMVLLGKMKGSLVLLWGCDVAMRCCAEKKGRKKLIQVKMPNK